MQKLFSAKAALNLEPLMTDTVQVMCEQLEARFMSGVNAGKTCDIAEWISFCKLAV